MTRGARRSIIGVVVLVVLLIAADRISLIVAEGVAATSIKDSQHLDSTPSVSAKGFPFLTQLISGHYGEVDVSAHGVEVGAADRSLRVDTVSVALHNLHISHGFTVLETGTATATALISYTDLSHTLGTTVSYAGSGRVSASAGLTIAGVALRGSVTVRPVLASGNQLAFSDTQVSALGVAAPPELNQMLSNIFDTAISLASLPFGLKFTGIDAGQAGIIVSLVGTNLRYDS